MNTPTDWYINGEDRKQVQKVTPSITTSNIPQYFAKDCLILWKCMWKGNIGDWCFRWKATHQFELMRFSLCKRVLYRHFTMQAHADMWKVASGAFWSAKRTMGYNWFHFSPWLQGNIHVYCSKYLSEQVWFFTPIPHQRGLIQLFLLKFWFKQWSGIMPYTNASKHLQKYEIDPTQRRKSSLFPSIVWAVYIKLFTPMQKLFRQTRCLVWT